MTRVLIAGMLLGFAFAAAAQDVEPEEQAASTRTDRAKASEPFCIRETGSRVIAHRNARTKKERADCVASGGRVYTREDIESTGSVDLVDALRRLDPSIR
ncbi:hypothetical protein [Luteimonas suaedae]|uniref:hypothetical protein n=1 Tax=Luteimonas suaedae TaxID=2605430 RepID=UPI0011F081A8|nr:hypothetical protein [Luteimonas suaedae]